VHRAADLKASTIVTLFEKTDALRRPERFRNCSKPACATTPAAWAGKTALRQPQRLLTALAAVHAVPAGEIAAACSDPGKIPERIHAARVRAVKQALNEPGEQPEQQ
jgi:tRNA nucleotidyltransferase (CCA-adding enzyme)